MAARHPAALVRVAVRSSEPTAKGSRAPCGGPPPETATATARLIAVAAGEDAIDGGYRALLPQVGLLPLAVAFTAALAVGLASIAALKLVVGNGESHSQFLIPRSALR